MAGYIGSKVPVVTSGTERKQHYNITTTTTSLTGLQYTPTKVHVFHNGVRLVDGTDYTATTGTSITLTNAAENGDDVVVISYASFQTSDTVSAANGGTFAGNVTMSGDLKVDEIYNQSGDNDSGLDLSTNDVVAVKTGNTERMRITSDGDVGIGTSSPTFTSGYGGIHLANDYAEIHLTNSGSGSTATDGFKIQQNSAHNTYLWNYESAFIALATNNAERMRIDDAGRVLVGCASSPTASVYGSGFVPEANGRQVLFQSGSTTAQVSVQRFFNPNGQVGEIKTQSSSTLYVTSSDYRLKTDAQPLTGASARVQALNPVNFEWIADGTRVDGFLAHEAQTVVPEAVVGTKDAVDEDGNPEYQGIDQSKLVPLLTAALQEALTEIADLKARVTALEAN